MTYSWPVLKFQNRFSRSSLVQEPTYVHQHVEHFALLFDTHLIIILSIIVRTL